MKNQFRGIPNSIWFSADITRLNEWINIVQKRSIDNSSVFLHIQFIVYHYGGATARQVACESMPNGLLKKQLVKANDVHGNCLQWIWKPAHKAIEYILH